MRKGTRSCTECESHHLQPVNQALAMVSPRRYFNTRYSLSGRQRKVKCEFPSGATRCLSCDHYDTRCIDQRNRVDTADLEADTPPRHRRAHAGSLQRQLLGTATRTPRQDIDSQEDDSQEWLGSATDIEALETRGVADQRAPFVSLLENANTSYMVNTLSMSERTIHTPRRSVNSRPESYGNPNTPDPQLRFQIAGTTPRSRSEKAQGVCQALRSAMPSFDAMMSILRKNGVWWNSFRQKTHAISQTPLEGLNVFASRAYTSNHPAILGTLVTAYARSLDQGSDLYELVGLLVISDFAYAATLEGMECLVLLAKSYTDIGQPRRAWLTWRQGLAIAQLMVRLSPSPLPGPQVR